MRSGRDAVVEFGVQLITALNSEELREREEAECAMTFRMLAFSAL